MADAIIVVVDFKFHENLRVSSSYVQVLFDRVDALDRGFNVHRSAETLNSDRSSTITLQPSHVLQSLWQHFQSLALSTAPNGSESALQYAEPQWKRTLIECRSMLRFLLHQRADAKLKGSNAEGPLLFAGLSRDAAVSLVSTMITRLEADRSKAEAQWSKLRSERCVPLSHASSHVQ